MADIYEMAKDLGGALGRTDEYQALKRATQAVDDDRELVELRNQLAALEERIGTMLRSGEEPGEEVATEYGGLTEKLQVQPAFQRLVAAQANFDKVMVKVNDTMARGLQEGAQSRIIISS